MAGRTKEIRLKFTEKGAAKVKSQVSQIDKASQKLVGSLKTMATGFAAAFGAMTVIRAMKDVFNASVAQEEIFRRLQTSIELTGTKYQNVKKDIDKTFRSLQNLTEYGDTDSAQVLTKLVTLTADYDKAMKALPITLDLAATGLFDVNTSARYVALGLQGNIEMLARYISELKATNNEWLKGANATEKAEYFIKILNEKFAGTAQKNVESYAGKMKQLNNEFTDLKELMGDLAQEDAKRMAEALTDLTREINILMGATDKNNKSWLEWVGIWGMFKSIKEGTIKGIEGLAWAISQLKAKNLETTQSFDDLFETISLEEITKMYDLAGAMDDVAEYTGLAAVKTEQFWEAFEKRGATREAIENLAEIAEGIRGARMEFEELPEVALPAMVKVDEGWQSMIKMADKFSNTLSQVWIEQWQEGGDFLDRLKNAFITTLEAMVAELMARAAIFAIFSLFPGGGTLLGGFSSYIMGRQGGGPVQKNKPYIVGEKGPELFVPQQSGNIEKNIAQNITIVTSDPKSFEQWLRENEGGKTIQRLLAEA